RRRIGVFFSAAFAFRRWGPWRRNALYPREDPEKFVFAPSNESQVPGRQAHCGKLKDSLI
ncbi:hypothetical protein, partial [Agrobacterium pusense]|uniref:hypothetical protein n=1 Tax=Agrobacterium pusense TaxID=648995 RepID=UPI001AEC814B